MTNKKPYSTERCFWKFIEKTEGCWLFKGSRLPSGYGTLSFIGKRIYAHRLSWLLHRGDIPDGMQILHKCDNPPCVNPAHLSIGTPKENMQDMIMKKRNKYFFTKSPLRGKDNPNSVLTEDKVREMRKLKGKMSYFKIGKKFGCAWQTAGHAVSGRTWAWVK